MKDLKDFEEELYKCSRCGLCQSVCPVYKSSLNECAVSKGKFNMLNGVLNDDLQVSKQLKKYLDMCTGCNACRNFCPSSIDARQIIQCAKTEYYKNNKLSVIENVLNSYSLLKSILLVSKPCFALYRFLHLDFFVNACEPLLLKSEDLGKKILLLNFIAQQTKSSRKKSFAHPQAKKLIYFNGCVNKYINPQTEQAVFGILNRAGYKIVKKNFECCGVSFLNDGNINQLIKVINKNLKKFPADYDAVLTDCASCHDVLKHYKDYTEAKAAIKLAENTISVLELIKGIRFKTSKKIKVAVHVPCHENFDLVNFLKNIDGVEYINTPEFDKCCGFSGAFAVKFPDISKRISLQKAQNYISSGADIVVTTCPSCLIGLEQGFICTNKASSKRPKVMNLFDFLDKYCTSFEV